MDAPGHRPLTRDPLLIVFALAVVIRVLFAATYPLNLAGDGGDYYEMMIHYNSSLVHAGGYPFVFGLPLYIARQFLPQEPVKAETAAISVAHDSTTPTPAAAVAEPIPRPVRYVLQYGLLLVQHVVDLGILWLLASVIRRIFGTYAAVYAVALIGLNPFVFGKVSTTRPEWFQSALVLGHLCVLYHAYAARQRATKLVLYASASALLMIGILAKFNSLPWAMFLPATLWLDRERLTAKAFMAAACGVVCATVLVGFVYLFHLPSTGTTTLTYDTGWLLIGKAATFSSTPTLEAANGISTKRYKLLTYFLSKDGPLPFGGAHLFRRVDAVPAEVRTEYRRRYAYLLSASEAELNAALALHPAAATFLGDPQLAYYYMGLEAADTLGVSVFLEAVRAEPIRYLRSSVASALRSLVFIQKWPQFPVNRRLGWSDLESPNGLDPKTDVAGTLRFGYARVELKGNRNIYYQRPVLLMPGVDIFSWLSDLPYYWVPAASALSIAMACWCVMIRVRSGAWRESVVIPLALIAGTIAFMLFSGLLIDVREKELFVIQPYLCLLAATGLATLHRGITRRTAPSGPWPRP